MVRTARPEHSGAPRATAPRRPRWPHLCPTIAPSSTFTTTNPTGTAGYRRRRRACRTAEAVLAEILLSHDAEGPSSTSTSSTCPSRWRFPLDARANGDWTTLPVALPISALLYSYNLLCVDALPGRRVVIRCVICAACAPIPLPLPSDIPRLTPPPISRRSSPTPPPFYIVIKPCITVLLSLTSLVLGGAEVGLCDPSTCTDAISQVLTNAPAPRLHAISIIPSSPAHSQRSTYPRRATRYPGKRGYQCRKATDIDPCPSARHASPTCWRYLTRNPAPTQGYPSVWLTSVAKAVISNAYIPRIIKDCPCPYTSHSSTQDASKTSLVNRSRLLCEPRRRRRVLG
ncbi:hypothetical protein MKEN_01089800 [Mycena kentingensis (nom. inval.)]|nr:hypothetical protein MKEN_01089800 [Mycena kentingensis (nom. inval.)]